MTARSGLVAVAAVVTALVTSGCATGTTTVKTGDNWLVKVNGDYANIYRYPPSNFPAKTTESVELGSTSAETQANLDQAAKKLSVPVANITNMTGS